MPSPARDADARPEIGRRHALPKFGVDARVAGASAPATHEAIRTRALLHRNNTRRCEKRSHKPRPCEEWTSPPGVFRLCHSDQRYYGWLTKPTTMPGLAPFIVISLHSPAGKGADTGAVRPESGSCMVWSGSPRRQTRRCWNQSHPNCVERHFASAPQNILPRRCWNKPHSRKIASPVDSTTRFACRPRLSGWLDLQLDLVLLCWRNGLEPQLLLPQVLGFIRVPRLQRWRLACED